MASSGFIATMILAGLLISSEASAQEQQRDAFDVLPNTSGVCRKLRLAGKDETSTCRFAIYKSFLGGRITSVFVAVRDDGVLMLWGKRTARPAAGRAVSEINALHRSLDTGQPRIPATGTCTATIDTSGEYLRSLTCKGRWESTSFELEFEGTGKEIAKPSQ